MTDLAKVLILLSLNPSHTNYKTMSKLLKLPVPQSLHPKNITTYLERFLWKVRQHMESTYSQLEKKKSLQLLHIINFPILKSSSKSKSDYSV